MNRTVADKTGRRDSCPVILGLFQKRINGDDALLQLARLRFSQAGLGMELYAETLQEIEYLLQFKPRPEATAAVHLKRGLNIMDEKDRSIIADFAARAGGHVFGFIVHDQTEAATQFEDYTDALRKLDSRLQTAKGPNLFIEYASGLDTAVFINLFRTVRSLKNISACVDVGHVGIWKARKVFSQIYSGLDVCAIRTDDQRLEYLMEDISHAVESALPEALRLIRAIAALGKPLHFHLHDGHPLSASSPFGVSDHMSFLDTIPLPFDFMGRRAADLMYGLSGLSSIVSAAMEILPPEKMSFSLEIHPRAGRLPLGDASSFFDHWKDKTNAEKMNYWLAVLLQNKKLIEEACRAFHENKGRK